MKRMTQETACEFLDYHLTNILSGIFGLSKPDILVESIPSIDDTSILVTAFIPPESASLVHYSNRSQRSAEIRSALQQVLAQYGYTCGFRTIFLVYADIADA